MESLEMQGLKIVEAQILKEKKLQLLNVNRQVGA